MADGRILGNTRSNLRTAWVFAVFWALVSAPLLVVVPRELERNPMAALGFLFPLVGLGLLTRAGLLTLRWRRFGPSSFEMSPMPATPGGRLGGTLRTQLASGNAASIRVTLTLTCLRRVISGRGKNRDTREHIVWREEYQVPEGQIVFGPLGASIPVRFTLPPDAAETTATGQSAGVFWVLAAEAELPGVNLNEDFDVPVARTAAEDAGPAFNDPPGARPEPVSPADLGASGIHIRPTSTGTEYRFAAARNVAFSAGTTAFLLVWTGAIWLQVAPDFPLFFPIVTGLFEVILLLVVVDLWFGSTTVSIGGGEVRRRHSLFGVGGTQVIPCALITKLDLHISMQTSGRSGTPYYELRATQTNGRRTSLGGGIRNKRHAEWLASQMRAAIGLSH